MIEPVPSAAKSPYQAFALRSADANDARRIAMLHVAGDAAWRTAMVAWVASPRERLPDHHRLTALDPCLGRVVERLRAHALAAGEDGEPLALALAGWSDAAGEVFARAEDAAMSRALRTERLLELDVPAIILENELDALARAIAGLRVPPAPEPVPHEEDVRELFDVPDAIVHHARYDLSLGLHSETLRVLEHVERKLGRDLADLAARLTGGDTLVPFPALDTAHQAAAADAERMLLARLRFWKLGPEPEELAEVATELADRLAKVTPAVRAKSTRELDVDTHRDLAGGDFVRSAEMHLRTIAQDAATASREGLVVLSEMSRSLAYG
jgi:hypothetical protein